MKQRRKPLEQAVFRLYEEEKLATKKTQRVISEPITATFTGCNSFETILPIIGSVKR